MQHKPYFISYRRHIGKIVMPGRSCFVITNKSGNSPEYVLKFCSKTYLSSFCGLYSISAGSSPVFVRKCFKHGFGRPLKTGQGPITTIIMVQLFTAGKRPAKVNLPLIPYAAGNNVSFLRSVGNIYQELKIIGAKIAAYV